MKKIELYFSKNVPANIENNIISSLNEFDSNINVNREDKEFRNFSGNEFADIIITFHQAFINEIATGVVIELIKEKIIYILSLLNKNKKLKKVGGGLEMKIAKDENNDITFTLNSGLNTNITNNAVNQMFDYLKFKEEIKAKERYKYDKKMMKWIKEMQIDWNKIIEDEKNFNS